jgi:hypothetical protein
MIAGRGSGSGWSQIIKGAFQIALSKFKIYHQGVFEIRN